MSHAYKTVIFAWIVARSFITFIWMLISLVLLSCRLGLFDGRIDCYLAVIFVSYWNDVNNHKIMYRNVIVLLRAFYWFFFIYSYWLLNGWNLSHLIYQDESKCVCITPAQPYMLTHISTTHMYTRKWDTRETTSLEFIQLFPK